MAKKSGKRLGRGLSSLVSSTITQTAEAPLPAEEPQEAPVVAEKPATTPVENPDGPRVQMVSLDAIRTNPNQPRRTFDRDRLEALASSLRREGALQPIVLRHHHGGYELVAGERRFRASQIAGLSEIPALIRPVSDEKLLELALVENVQREALNPVEKARAYQQLAQKHGMSNDAIAEAMGEDRSTVANTIRLLGLSDHCLTLLAEQKLSSGHARALLSVADPVRQAALADRAVEEGWSVRKLESEAAAIRDGATKPEPASKPQTRPAVADLQEQLTSAVGSKVVIKEGRKRNSGKIVIHYYNLESFESIAERLGVQREEL